MISPQWLRWAQEIQALAQTSCHYAENDYQRQRAQRLVAIAAEIVSTQTTLDNKAIEKIYLAPVGYATPRVDVRAAVFQDGKLLMVRECQDGGWTLPGGWADVGDTPSEASEREVWEEAGFRVKAQRVIGVYDANRTGPLELFHAFKIVFMCELISGEARTSDETSAVAFFGPDEIPEILSGERTRKRHIRDAFAALADARLPTVFD